MAHTDGNLSSRVVSTDGDLSSRVVFTDGDLSSRVVCTDGNLSSRVVSTDGSVITGGSYWCWAGAGNGADDGIYHAGQTGRDKIDTCVAGSASMHRHHNGGTRTNGRHAFTTSGEKKSVINSPRGKHQGTVTIKH